MRIAGREHEVAGEAWLDREWSTSALGPDYIRIRLGIGRPPPDFRGDVADFVLQAFPPTELPEIEKMLGRAVEAVSLLLSQGLDKAMNRINQRPAR